MIELKQLIRLRRENSGQSLVEFALVLPLLLFLLMTIFEFGNIFHSYLLITQASREGARMGVVGEPNAEIENRVHEICSVLNTSKLTIDIYPNDDKDPDSGKYLYRNRGVPLEVTLDYQVDLFTPLMGSILDNPFPIKAKSIMRIE